MDAADRDALAGMRWSACEGSGVNGLNVEATVDGAFNAYRSHGSASFPQDGRLTVDR